MLEILFTAVALAMDSFALSIVGGSLNRRLNFLQILKIALIFALFQAFMPLFGYIFGAFIAKFILSIHHYIAFAILFGIGIKFILESKEIKSKSSVDFSFFALMMGGFITSIDAFAVGITFGFSDISIEKASFVIGLVCFIFCIIGAYIGKTIGKLYEDKALIIGGIILMGIGYKILLEKML